MAPGGGAGADLDGALAAPVPAWHGDALPGRGRVGQHLGRVRQALAFCAGPPDGAGQVRRRGVIQRRIQPQAGGAGHAPAADGGQELQGGKAAAGHDDQLAAG